MDEKKIVPETNENTPPVLELKHLVVHCETPWGVG